MTGAPEGEDALSVARALVRSSLLGIVRADAERVLEANDAFLRMAGCSRDDLATGGIAWKEIVGQTFVDRVVEPFPKEFVRRDGTRVPLLIAAVLTDNVVPEWIAFLVDLSATELKEERLRLQQQALEIAVRGMHAFSAMLFRELRRASAGDRGRSMEVPEAAPGNCPRCGRTGTVFPSGNPRRLICLNCGLLE